MPPTRPLPKRLADQQLASYWPPDDGPKALFLDYDGTLREFEPRPEQAVPTQEIKDLLAAIDSRQDLVPHVVSGRDAAFLETHFGSLRRFTLVAEHGFQIRRPGSRRWESWHGPEGCGGDPEGWKATMRAAMGQFVDSTPGSHLEEKASSLVWHYREAAEAQGEQAARAVVEHLARVRDLRGVPGVRIARGHKIVEVSSDKVHKGLVLRSLCREWRLALGVPFAAVLATGDDTADELMFEAAPRRALTVKVGPGTTRARFRVSSPPELRSFLMQVAASR